MRRLPPLYKWAVQIVQINGNRRGVYTHEIYTLVEYSPASGLYYYRAFARGLPLNEKPDSLRSVMALINQRRRCAVADPATPMWRSIEASAFPRGEG